MPSNTDHDPVMNGSDSNKKLFELLISQEFIDSLSEIYSDRLLSQIKHTLRLLSSSPEIGSLNVRPVLSKMYGEGIRKIPISTFLIIYRFDGDQVEVLALVPGPLVF